MTIDVERLYDRRADNRWDRVSVGDVFERLTWSAPDEAVLIATEDAVADPAFTTVTSREADAVANRVANALLADGLQRGDRVAMYCDNSNEAFITKIGIAKAGGVALPINTMMAADMVAHTLGFTEPRLAVVDADLWARCQPMLGRAGVRPVASIAGAAAPAPGSCTFAEWIAAHPDTEPEVRIHGDDIWEILLTSGTTAMPKAVMISHHYTHYAGMAHGLSYSRGLANETQLRTCSFLPFVFHIGDHAHVFSSLLAGGSVVVGRRLDHALVARAVTEHRVSCLWAGSPQFIGELLDTVEEDRGAYDFSALQVVVYGWTALRPDVVDRLQALCGGVELVGIFGQTEAISCHRWWPNRWEEVHRRTSPALNYVGVPNGLLASDVVDLDGKSLRDQPGEVGEAVYRSPVVTQGYYRDEQSTRDAFRGGWFHSGDLCAYDEDGLRTMLDRSKDIVKSGGENVSSIRVEAVLVQHPAVGRCAVVGLPDDRWGEAVTACVVPASGALLDEADVIAYCRARLAGYETPKRVIVLDDLPVTVGGKVLKHKLREQLTTA